MTADELKINYSVPVAEDMDFQRRVWCAERIGWALMAAVIIAALLGFFAVGPVSQANIRTQNLQIDYERFGRYSLPTHYNITADANGPLRLSESFHDYYTLKMTPAPSREIFAGTHTRYFFDTATSGPLYIRIEAKPIKAGIFTGHIGIGDEPPAALSQFIYR